MRLHQFTLLICLAILLGTSVLSPARSESPPKKENDGWLPLLDAKSKKNWKVLSVGDFQNGGEVTFGKDVVTLKQGEQATGIGFKGKFPRSNYTLQLQARRDAGSDFFCGLSFPVNDGSVTLILGGWGGGVVGLSCIDGHYAVNNNTSLWFQFAAKKWYKIEVAVTDEKVKVAIDGKLEIDFELEDHELAVSEEMEPCLPLGLATWKTTGTISNLRYRLHTNGKTAKDEKADN